MKSIFTSYYMKITVIILFCTNYGRWDYKTKIQDHCTSCLKKHACSYQILYNNYINIFRYSLILTNIKFYYSISYSNSLTKYPLEKDKIKTIYRYIAIWFPILLVYKIFLNIILNMIIQTFIYRKIRKTCSRDDNLCIYNQSSICVLLNKVPSSF
jgi:hypothetical protein